MRALLEHDATAHDEDAVSVLDCGEPMRDGDGGAAGGSLVERVLDNTLRLGVEGGGSLVQEQDARVGDNGAGDGNTLLLTTRQKETALADHGVVGFGELRNEAVRIRLDTGLLDERELLLPALVLVDGTNETVRDVALDGGSEERRLLTDETNLRTKPLDIQLLEINTVETDNAGERVVEALDERDAGRLAGARCTNKGARLAGREGQAEVLHDGHIGPGGVVEVDALERDLAYDLLGLETSRVGGVDGWDAVHGGVQLGRSATPMGNG